MPRRSNAGTASRLPANSSGQSGGVNTNGAWNAVTPPGTGGNLHWRICESAHSANPGEPTLFCTMLAWSTSPEARVVGAIDLAHTAGAKRRGDLAGPQPGTGSEWHRGNLPDADRASYKFNHTVRMRCRACHVSICPVRIA